MEVNVTTVLNYTQHVITIVDNDGNIVQEFPSVGNAQVETTSRQVGDVNGVAIVHTEFGDITGLPDPAPDTLYIVGMIVAQAARRSDLISPDTGPSAFRKAGQIVGVRRFARY
jgi:hypothetical protein